MPELPDITVYIEALERRILNEQLTGTRVASPFVVRSVDPPVAALSGNCVRSVTRLGKQIVLGFDNDLFLIVHLMIAGRFQWKDRRAAVPGKIGLAAFDFTTGTLLLTEAGSKKRASLLVVRGKEALQAFDRKATDVFETTPERFMSVLCSENHTLKRALTDPRLLSGIGNAYSDEILHRARLSPLKLTLRISGEEGRRLFEAARATLLEWTARLRKETGDGFPSKVTAFRPEMAVHGRYGKPCPVCQTAVQRIVYAENECNYCPTCQTGGKFLADRAMSRLLKEDWPRSIEEMEKHFEQRR